MGTFEELIAGARVGDLSRMARALALGAPINGAPAPVYNREISAYTGDVTALMTAAACGQAEAVAFLIDRGAALDMNDGEGMTALHCALTAKSAPTMRVLVDRGASLGSVSMGGGILGTAVRYMQPEDIEYLLAKGADPNERIWSGETPLHAAAGAARADLIPLLLKHGADAAAVDQSGETPLAIATRRRDIATITALQRAVPPADATESLMIAAQSGDMVGIRLAFEEGADVNRVKEAPPLIFATMGGHAGAMAMLLELGADINLPNARKDTALHCSIAIDRLDLVQLLVERGASLTQHGYSNGAPLYFAATRGNAEIAAYLISQGACVNDTTNYGYTPLWAAVAYRHVAVIKLLMAHGADPNLKGYDDSSAMKTAQNFNGTDILDLLRGKLKD